MTRRGTNEGSIYKRIDGRWVGVVHLGYEGGHRRRKAIYGKTRQDVARKLATALKAKQDGLPLPGDRETCESFLGQWLESVRPSLRPRTWTRYESLIRIHALPSIGRVPLAKLAPAHLQKLYASRLDAGQSPASVRQLHAVLHRALRQAFRWSLVARNVGDMVTAPRVERHQIKTLEQEQARALLEVASGDRFEALYVLALSTGMRLGELMAVRWADVDLELGSLYVRGTLIRTSGNVHIAEPKTARSRRRIELTALAVDAIRRHRVGQNEERLRLGDAWANKDLAFCNEVGDFLSETHLRRKSFAPLLRRAGLPHMRFHDLRHTAATLLLARGVHPKIVSEMLGHSSIAITLDLYSHVTPTMQRETAAVMDSVLSGA